MTREEVSYPGASWAEEEKARAWETLSAAEKARQIEKARLDQIHWGRCQKCGFRIEATGAAWPTRCPNCNYGDPDAG